LSNPFDYKQFTNELNRETDRGTALVCAALLDSLLEQLLKAYLIVGKETDSLFDGDRPLASFSAKTGLAFSMGLISKLEFEDLTSIRRIRNDFAHDLGISFGTTSISDRCRTLKSYSEAFRNAQEIDLNQLGPKRSFTVTSVGIALSLGHRAEEVIEHRVRFVWQSGPYGEWAPQPN